MTIPSWRRCISIGLCTVMVVFGCDARDREESEAPPTPRGRYGMYYNFEADSIDRARLSAGLSSLSESSGGYVTGEVFLAVWETSRAYVVGFTSTLSERGEEMGITVVGEDGAHVPVLWTGIQHTEDGGPWIQEVHLNGDTVRVDFCAWPDGIEGEALTVSLIGSVWSDIEASEGTCPP